MSRKGGVKKREFLPDPKYGSVMVTRMINYIMKDGKRSKAEKIFYEALDKAAAKAKEDPMKLLNQVFENVKPILEVRPRRIGGATYQIPMEVSPHRQKTLVLRWTVEAARARKERTMVDRLAGELLDAYNGVGAAIKKKEDTHKMAEANRAFAHYRW